MDKIRNYRLINKELDIEEYEDYLYDITKNGLIRINYLINFNPQNQPPYTIKVLNSDLSKDREQKNGLLSQKMKHYMNLIIEVQTLCLTMIIIRKNIKSKLSIIGSSQK